MTQGPLLTEGLLSHDEAADDHFISASESEAVSSQNYVKGLWKIKRMQIRAGGACMLHLLILLSRVPWCPSLRSPFKQTLEGSTLRISVHDRFNIWRMKGRKCPGVRNKYIKARHLSALSTFKNRLGRNT